MLCPYRKITTRITVLSVGGTVTETVTEEFAPCATTECPYYWHNNGFNTTGCKKVD